MRRKITGYLTKNRYEKDQKIAQSIHENGNIKQRKTFCRNSKQFLTLQPKRGCDRKGFSPTNDTDVTNEELKSVSKGINGTSRYSPS